MSVDNVRLVRSPSPSSSGRDSPAPARRSFRRPGEEDGHKHDKPYRRYASNIDKTLNTFDSTLEWPDYIAFLGRLLKTIQSHPPYANTLPHAQSIAHRLAQCLRPSLPSGVHQKALETYEFILRYIGKDSLADHLPVFLPGLSPVLTFASLSLRPLYLSLIEDHILKIRASALRPAFRALLLCLLPGLEEESSDEFEKTLQIVDSLRHVSDEEVQKEDGVTERSSSEDRFWQCLFLASIQSRSRRSGALAYMIRRMPKLEPTDDSGSTMKLVDLVTGTQNLSISPAAQSLISPEPGLLIRCFATGLEDDQPLIQRGFLDLLTTHLPLSSPILTQRVTSTDLMHLMTAAIGVVSRRDMSLNRRLWSWFLGPQGNIDEETGGFSETSPIETLSAAVMEHTSTKTYFQKFGQEALASSVRALVSQAGSTPASQARPFRICLSLMDRQEIGGCIVQEVFEPSMSKLLAYKNLASSEDFVEVSKSASSFFDGIESGAIWSELISLMRAGFAMLSEDPGHAKRKLGLISFVLSNFNIREEEMLAFHIPLFVAFAATLLVSLESRTPDGSSESLDTSEVTNILEKLVSLMPERVSLNDSFAQSDSAGESHSGGSVSNGSILSSIQSFYLVTRGNISANPPPFSSKKTAEILLVQSSRLYLHALSTEGVPSAIQESRCRIFATLLNKIPDDQSLNVHSILKEMHQGIKSSQSTSDELPFTIHSTTAEVVSRLVAHAQGALSPELSSELQCIIHFTVHQLWRYLDPSNPKHHVETVRCIWKLNDTMPQESFVEAAISTFLVQSKTNKTSPPVVSARRFGVLWNHTVQPLNTGVARNLRRGSVVSTSKSVLDLSSHQEMLHRPLYLLLEGLRESDSELAHFVRTWLTGLPSLKNVLALLISNVETTYLNTPGAIGQNNQSENQRRHTDASLACLYFLNHVKFVLSIPGSAAWSLLNTTAEASSLASEKSSSDIRLDMMLTKLCVEIAKNGAIRGDSSKTGNLLSRTALSVVTQILSNSKNPGLVDLKLDEIIISILRGALKSKHSESALVMSLLDTMTLSLKFKSRAVEPSTPKLDARPGSSDAASVPPPQLVECIQEGLSSTSSQLILDQWVRFLVDALPLYAGQLFQNMIPLVETFCREITKKFGKLREVFQEDGRIVSDVSETSLTSLLEGLEHVLAAAHDRLAFEEGKAATAKSPEQPQGFFGNVVSGVFTNESSKSRQSLGNTRLTVLLCFQDTVRICYSIWLWGSNIEGKQSQSTSSSASASYISVRLRNKARKMLDRMFAAEPLECLETTIAEWASADIVQPSDSPAITLLHTLTTSRPKAMMPAIFDSIYSRTNPSALERSRTSSLTSEIAVPELAFFLVDYTTSLEDDAMDEVWHDCMSFLRDVLSNPLPQSLILPLLLKFISILAQKAENTNFGDQRKMRKDLGDVFVRLLAVTFTTRSGGLSQENTASAGEKGAGGTVNGKNGVKNSRHIDLIDIINELAPQLPAVLGENERISSVASTISSNIINPVMHSKAFPSNIKAAHLLLLEHLTKLSLSSKTLRRDVADLFNNVRMFSLSPKLVEDRLLPIVRQTTLGDKDRIPELLSRIAPPTSAGIMFGVGASAARTDADKKTQLTLRRIALIIMSMDEDYAASHMDHLQAKVEELLNASLTSSPSALTRAEVFMLLRALVLSTSSTQLAPLWPVITSELQRALSSATKGNADYETYNVHALCQASKLLDLLLIAAPEDFQLYQWLFITDTIDAVYRPADYQSAGLVDELAEDLGSSLANQLQTPTTPLNDFNGLDLAKAEVQKTALEINLSKQGSINQLTKEEFVGKILRPWFSQLSISTYETTYSLRKPDVSWLRSTVLADLFDDLTIVG